MQLRKYLTFTLIVGTITGFLSMVSDMLPYQDATTYDVLIRFVSQFINNTITWLALSMLVGYLFCQSKTQAALAGAGFALFSIVTFLLFGLLNLDQVPSNVRGVSVAAIAQWLALSAVGGLVGGLIGFIAKKRPIVLLLFVGYIAYRLIPELLMPIQQSPATIAQNALFIVTAVVIAVWLIIRGYKH